ncbi:hypothetical protein [Antarcticirhabdus aurantiaca]|uniref:hypothetical protein n=1 Tax=Antarcticirhabdus aurantiaca TaxID=2606717 RepID=UPI00131E92D5|nr:hypothetical protein [Antarcticirhabdus aurantiaca]
MLKRVMAAIARALKATAAAVLLPIYGMVDGVRTILGWFSPPRPTAVDDVAQEVVAENVDVAAEKSAVVEERRERVRLSESERIRRAARSAEFGYSIGTDLLDPETPAEREILGWILKLDALQLGMLSKAGDDDIQLHLAGVQRLRMPLLPRDQIPLDTAREAREERARPPTAQEWVGILASRAASRGDDDPDVDAILAAAEKLAEAGATLEDRPEE